MLADETTTIVKYSECTVKFNDCFTALEDDALTKTVQLPKHLSKTMNFPTETNPRATVREYTPTCAFFM